MSDNEEVETAEEPDKPPVIECWGGLSVPLIGAGNG